LKRSASPSSEKSASSPKRSKMEDDASNKGDESPDVVAKIESTQSPEIHTEEVEEVEFEISEDLKKENGDSEKTENQEKSVEENNSSAAEVSMEE